MCKLLTLPKPIYSAGERLNPLPVIKGMRRFEVVGLDREEVKALSRLGYGVWEERALAGYVTEQLTVSCPSKVPAMGGGTEWWTGEGKNHRIEGGKATRELWEEAHTFYVLDLPIVRGHTIERLPIAFTKALRGEGYSVEVVREVGRPYPLLVLEELETAGEDYGDSPIDRRLLRFVRLSDCIYG